MPRQLHIVVSPPDEFARGIIEALRRRSGSDVEVVELASEDPDYSDLVTKIFAADSIVTW
jgi:hypothetical protein